MKTYLKSEQVIDFYTQKLEDILNVKRLVGELDPNYITHTRINPKNDVLLTIVMTTTPKRRSQTMFSLTTIRNSSIWDKTQVILVDDSDGSISELPNTDLFIDYIRIQNKFWVNPCVNYNIGFKFIEADKVIIQNGEVCHVGDVCKRALEQLEKGCYLVFDVLALNQSNLNPILHQQGEHKFADSLRKRVHRSQWYQHNTERNAYLHFLTAIMKTDLELIGGFDLDYSMATCFDDPAFIDQLHSIDLKFVNVQENNHTLFGIHQWHEPENPKMTTTNVHNQHLLFAKQKHFAGYHEYPNITDKDIIQKLFSA